MKKMLFIMNPFSGMRRANRYLADIISLFNQADYEVNIHMTSGHGDATQFAQRHAQDVDLVDSFRLEAKSLVEPAGM